MDEAAVRHIGVDPDTLEVFFREHVEAVQRFVARRVSDPHLAADITADIFLTAMTSSGGYRADRGSPQAWLFGIGRNVIAAEARRQRRHLELAPRVQGHRELAEDALERLEERISAQNAARRIYRAIADLPDADRELIEFIDVDGLSIQEVAAATGLRPGTVRVRLHRARSRVRRRIEGETSPREQAPPNRPHLQPIEETA